MILGNAVSIKLILTFFVLTVLSTYFAFLNPDEVHVRFTQKLAVHVPQVVFLLASSLLGVFATTLIYWSDGIRRTYETLKLKNFHKRQIKELESLNRLYQKGENIFIAGHRKKAQKLFEKITLANRTSSLANSKRGRLGHQN